MEAITALFWDVGGVLLTNGWDRTERRRAAERFDLDFEQLEIKHQPLAEDLECGRISLDAYFDRVVFDSPRRFNREEFRAFLFSCSQPNPETLAIVERLVEARRYFMATLNNESLELNQYRIETFGLTRYFPVFLTSSVLGVRKPDPLIYRRALQITQRTPRACAFIDDRLSNVQAAQQLEIQGIHYQNPKQLREELARMAVSLD